MPESFKVLVKELQSLGLDVRLYSEDNQELELKENIEEGIEYDPEKEGKLLSEEEVISDDDLEGYSQEDDKNILLENDETLIEDDEELFGSLDDEEDDELLFGNDLANDNLDNDDDIIE